MRYLWFLLLLAVLGSTPAWAQTTSGELAATLEVLEPTVEVRRVNTVNWIAVSVEAIVGVGDVIRTGANGRARITFFADGVDTELLPNTQYRIQRFEGNGDSFNITVEVLVGQTTQRLSRLLDANSSYDVFTPGMALAARGTQFAIRVEDSGRSAMLVSEGTVDASQDDASAEVPPEFGIRAAAGSGLSDVVRARSFEELDAALDGCPAALTTPDDTSLNVRIGARRDFPRVGTIAPEEVTVLIGVVESGDWYRIPFRGGFGWILSSTADISDDCVGLREFPDNYGPEDTTLYASLGDEIAPEDLIVPTPGA
ncbi:MAG: FecR domain-containing protein [Chloroflexi bacterium]|nr:FecR domain-containing protein [Chloroflexota bacterium]